ncbi:MAG: HPr(Ser) kinase/phosphatase [Spirochaetia bacterium]|nr:HPr(Ser) kinase/phosphatase [Spirochaetia bacterium]
MSFIEVSSLLSIMPNLHLSVVAGKNGLDRHIVTTDVNRPGLALAGFYKNLASKRVQVFGKGEQAFIQDCSEDELERIIAEFFKYKFPALIFTHDTIPPERFIEAAEKSSTPIFRSSYSTHDFIIQYTRVITEELAPSTSIHGVLIEVFGVGVLLMGASGIGKSETAIELIERGHRLIADDIVKIRCLNNTQLYGYTSELIQHHMELRGIGIINVKDLFGVGAIRQSKRLELVVYLEDWDPSKDYERLGLNEETVDILGVQLERLLIPVRPGRNVPILIETAAMNFRSKLMGYHAAKDLSDRIASQIEKKSGSSKK